MQKVKSDSIIFAILIRVNRMYANSKFIVIDTIGNGSLNQTDSFTIFFENLSVFINGNRFYVFYMYMCIKNIRFLPLLNLKSIDYFGNKDIFILTKKKKSVNIAEG